MALGSSLRPLPPGGTFYLLYVHSSPFPRPNNLPAPGSLGSALLGEKQNIILQDASDVGLPINLLLVPITNTVMLP
jgi:hypothetical protein